MSACERVGRPQGEAGHVLATADQSGERRRTIDGHAVRLDRLVEHGWIQEVVSMFHS